MATQMETTIKAPPADKYEDQPGYIQLGDYYINPTTPIGSMLINAVKSGNELWTQYFPYSDGNIQNVMFEVLDEMGGEVNDQKKIEVHQNTFKEIKKFLVSSNKLGIFNESAQSERCNQFL